MPPVEGKPPRAWLVWERLIADEELYRATIAGTHAELAKSRGFEAADVAVLDQFHRMPGTRWNMENLRFRSAEEIANKLEVHMPRTVALLTRGIEEWRRDLFFEYLAYYRWQEFGHAHVVECERFVDYVHERIAKRRRLPDHLESVMTVELGVARLLRATKGAAWPKLAGWTEDAVAAARPQRAPVVDVIEVPDDISEWVASGDPLRGTVKQGPLVLLASIAGPDQPQRLQKLSEGARYVLDQCTGTATAREIAARIEAEDVGLSVQQVLAQIGRWLRDGILVDG